ncbi:MAG: hypothetical protein WA924_01075 [Burkholderiaceae bacterium]
MEHYGSVIGDKNEGLHKTELSLAGGGEIDLAGNSPEATFFRKHVLRPDQRDSKVKIVLEDGARLIAHSNSPDLYIYCLTSEYNPGVMKQFGCDGCMEIINPVAFFSAVSHRIRHRGRFDGCGAVQYMSKDTHYTKPHYLHPAIMKDVEFSYQKEWRAIWIPNKEPKRPLFVQVPKAVKHCRVYARSGGQ